MGDDGGDATRLIATREDRNDEKMRGENAFLIGLQCHMGDCCVHRTTSSTPLTPLIGAGESMNKGKVELINLKYFFLLRYHFCFECRTIILKKR